MTLEESRLRAALAKAEEERASDALIIAARNCRVFELEAALGRAVAALHDVRGKLPCDCATPSDVLNGHIASCPLRWVDAVLADPTGAAAGEAWNEMEAVYKAVKAERALETHQQPEYGHALRQLERAMSKVAARRGV